jgi:hypothetical protein
MSLADFGGDFLAVARHIVSVNIDDHGCWSRPAFSWQSYRRGRGLSSRLFAARKHLGCRFRKIGQLGIPSKIA